MRDARVDLKYLFVFFTVLSLTVTGCGSGNPPESTVNSEPQATVVEPNLDALLATADVKRGQMLYLQCRACHSLNDGGANKVGPNLYGMFGKKAGQVPGFVYSDVMTGSEVVWNSDTVDAWIARPSEFMPGNQMVFVGVRDSQDRANLIAYLLQETGASTD